MTLTNRNSTSRRKFCALLRTGITVVVAVASLAFGKIGSALDTLNAPGSDELILESGLPNPSRGPGPFSGAAYSNQVVGATRFYDAGYTGTRALMANIEAGYIWNGHETLSHVG